jgi:ankyrin repeat protein
MDPIAIIQEYINNGCKYFSIYSSKLKSFVQNGGNINVTDCYQNNPLLLACYKGDAQLVEFLVKNGANPNTVDVLGNSALFACILDSKYDQAKILIDNGADINRCDNRGNKPIDHCYIYSSEKNMTLALYMKSLGGIGNMFNPEEPVVE